MTMLRSPAILGPSGSHGWLLGGSEDPWLCVSDFGQVCLYRNNSRTRGKLVNSGIYLAANVRFGSVAALPDEFNPMTALKRIAAVTYADFASPWINVFFYQ